MEELYNKQSKSLFRVLESIIITVDRKKKIMKRSHPFIK